MFRHLILLTGRIFLCRFIPQHFRILCRCRFDRSPDLPAVASRRTFFWGQRLPQVSETYIILLIIATSYKSMVHEAYVYSFYWFHSFITCVDLGQNDQNLCQPPKELPLRSGLLLAPVAAWTGSMPMEERIRTNECIAVWRPTTQRRARWKGRKGMGHLGDGFGIPWKSWNI